MEPIHTSERIHTSQVVSSEIRRGIGAAAVLLSVPTTAMAAPPDKPTSVGIIAGDPYFVGVIGETEPHHALAVQLHGGTNLEDVFGGGRLLLKHSGFWEPYVGVGVGFETRFTEIYPIGVGSVGLRLGRNRVRMFVELNEQLREEDRLGESQWSTGGAAGLLVEVDSASESHAPALQTPSEPDPATLSNKPRLGVAPACRIPSQSRMNTRS